MQIMTMRDAYRDLLGRLFSSDLEEQNSRTGTNIRMIRGAHSFKLDLSDRLLPVPGNRAYWPRIAAAEVAWQLLGTKDPKFIMCHAPKVWQDFIEDGELKTAYGYRWRKHFNRDQLALAISELALNPTNRQLYISAWDPAADGLGGPQPKNVPCPVGFSVSRTEDEVHMSVFIRSSDVVVGLPYDVMGYALMLDAISVSTGCTPGTLSFTLAHPHIYQDHFEIVESCLIGEHKTWTFDVEPRMPGWGVEKIESEPYNYLDMTRRLCGLVKQNPWNPMPKVVI